MGVIGKENKGIDISVNVQSSYSEKTGIIMVCY